MMEQHEKEAMVNALCGETDPNQLSAYLALAADKILNKRYPFGRKGDETVPSKYETLQCQIAAYLLNKRGMEGQTGHTESATTMQFESGDVPNSMLDAVIPTARIF